MSSVCGCDDVTTNKPSPDRDPLEPWLNSTCLRSYRLRSFYAQGNFYTGRKRMWNSQFSLIIAVIQYKQQHSKFSGTQSKGSIDFEFALAQYNCTLRAQLHWEIAKAKAKLFFWYVPSVGVKVTFTTAYCERCLKLNLSLWAIFCRTKTRITINIPIPPSQKQCWAALTSRNPVTRWQSLLPCFVTNLLVSYTSSIFCLLEVKQ